MIYVCRKRAAQANGARAMAETTPPSQRNPDEAYAEAQREIAEAARTKAKK